MFKLCIFAAILAVAFALPAADPKAEAKPEPKPGLITTYTAYHAPIIPALPTVIHNAPLTYSTYVAPTFYSGYPLNSHLIV